MCVCVLRGGTDPRRDTRAIFGVCPHGSGTQEGNRETERDAILSVYRESYARAREMCVLLGGGGGEEGKVGSFVLFSSFRA